MFRTYVALMLFLFAFFALITGSGRPDPDKWVLAADSLRATFATTDAARLPLGATTMAASLFLARLGDDLATPLGLSPVELLPGGDGMRMRLPAERLFDEGSARPRATMTALADRLATAMSASPAGTRVSVEALVPVTDGLKLARQRAAALARWLSERGAPASAITVSLAENGSDSVVLLVRVRAEARAPLTRAPAPPAPQGPKPPAAERR